MTGLGLGLENLVGLIAIFEGNENSAVRRTTLIYLSVLNVFFKNIVSYLRDFETKMAVIKRQTEKWISNNSRDVILNVV